MVNEDLTPALACKVGLAVASHAKAKKALVGRDTRVSGSTVEDALVSGLLACGVNVALAYDDKEAYPYLEVPEFNIKELDAVIISHAHLDHI